MHPFDKEMFKALDHSPAIPENPNYLRILKTIPRRYKCQADLMALTLAFHFGQITAKRCERDRIKWNATACFYGMLNYADFHGGQLPKTYQELREWVHRYDGK